MRYGRDVLGEATTWPIVLSAIAAGLAVIAAVAIPLTSFARRPKLSLAEDEPRVHTRIEGNGLPWLRLIVRNRKRRRAAHGTRVLLDHYRKNEPGADMVTMGSPALGWTSVFGSEAAIVFAGGQRTVDLGVLVPGWRGESRFVAADPQKASGATDDDLHWELRLHPAQQFEVLDQRDVLQPTTNGYTVRLVVGADDGAARTYDVDVNWLAKAKDAAEALDSIQVEVRQVRTI
jgi:hypothetical protein